jgi:hypothetical protein
MVGLIRERITGQVVPVNSDVGKVCPETGAPEGIGMTRTQEIPRDLQRSVSGLTSKVGLRNAAKTLRLSEKTVLRVAAGVPSTPGTVALVREALARESGAQ